MSRFTIHDLEFEPGRRAHFGQEFGAVACRPAGLRRNQSPTGYAARLHFVAAYFERAKGTFDRRRAEFAGSRQTFAQPDNPGK